MNRKDAEADIRALHCAWRRGARPQRAVKVCADRQQQYGEHALAYCIIRSGCHCLFDLPGMYLPLASSCLCLHLHENIYTGSEVAQAPG